MLGTVGLKTPLRGYSTSMQAWAGRSFGSASGSGSGSASGTRKRLRLAGTGGGFREPEAVSGAGGGGYGHFFAVMATRRVASGETPVPPAGSWPVTWPASGALPFSVQDRVILEKPAEANAALAVSRS
ncbi:hypothetical protein EDF22_2557 [Rathayibacter sp. PhB127]|nr:hypothetical protein EDF22_2557 [Rathayibacter sp. PhB127]